MASEVVIFNPIRAQLCSDHVYFNPKLELTKELIESNFDRVWRINQTCVKIWETGKLPVSFASKWPLLQNTSKKGLFCGGFSLRWDIVPFIIEKDWIVVKELVADFTKFDLEHGLSLLPPERIITIKDLRCI